MVDLSITLVLAFFGVADFKPLAITVPTNTESTTGAATYDIHPLDRSQHSQSIVVCATKSNHTL